MSRFRIRDLKKILDGLDENLPVVLDVKYDERYVLTDISVYEDECTPSELVIEAGYPHEISKTVLGDYDMGIEKIFKKYFNNQCAEKTPIPYSYIRWDMKEYTLLIEKSKNLNEDLFRTTYLVCADGRVKRIELDCLFENEKELDKSIVLLTVEQIENANRYGWELDVKEDV